jgi:hypothetical protein
MNKRSMNKPGSHTWEFKARFRRSSFGWRSQPALQRVREAVSEIKKVARRDPVLAAGAIGTAVNHAIGELVPIIARFGVGDVIPPAPRPGGLGSVSKATPKDVRR